MGGSIRTELAVNTPDKCPAAATSAEIRSRVHQITRSTTSNSSGRLTEEFTIDEDASIDRPELAEVYTYDTRTVYRFEREQTSSCVCDYIETFGCPVSEVHARDGTLYVSFYASDLQTIRDIVTGLDERSSNITVRQLTRSTGPTEPDLVMLDRSCLTDRQREVLEKSYEMGYFDHPKGANAGEVAEALDIAQSTYSEHLAAAQRKLLDTVLQS